MPEIIGRGHGRRLAALAGALALGAAACGGSTETTADIAAPGGSTTETTAGTVAGPAEGTSSSLSSSEAPAGQNLFPTVEVVNVVDSSTLTLSQELAGGDLPVLLWFWAPH
jgi:ABC-type glycerol-3-phosphate transport system substrate-binding protein